MARPADFDIHDLISDLQGTCNMLSSYLPEGMEEDDLTDDDRATIDNEIFLCETCGWWCEVCERAEEQDEDVCQDCKED